MTIFTRYIGAIAFLMQTAMIQTGPFGLTPREMKLIGITAAVSVTVGIGGTIFYYSMQNKRNILPSDQLGRKHFGIDKPKIKQLSPNKTPMDNVPVDNVPIKRSSSLSTMVPAYRSDNCVTKMRKEEREKQQNLLRVEKAREKSREVNSIQTQLFTLQPFKQHGFSRFLSVTVSALFDSAKKQTDAGKYIKDLIFDNLSEHGKKLIGSSDKIKLIYQGAYLGATFPENFKANDLYEVLIDYK